MQGKTKHGFQRLAAGWATLSLLFVMVSCGGSLYKVKPRVDAPVMDAGEATAGGLTVRAVPLLTDEESQDLFEANLPLAGLLPVRVEMRNETSAPLLFKRLRFSLHDGEGRVWKMRTAKQAVSRILKSDEVYLYNPTSRRKFEEEVSAHSFDLAAPLEAGQQRRGLIFFQTPKKEQVASPRNLVLIIEGLPQPVAVTLN
jgi:hypothetical protein